MNTASKLLQILCIAMMGIVARGLTGCKVRAALAMICLACMALTMGSCMSNRTVIEYASPTTGAYYKFSSGGDWNVTTSQDLAENQNTNILGLGQGGAVTDRTRGITQQAVDISTLSQPTIKLGPDVEVFGTLSHSTSIREFWIGLNTLGATAGKTALGWIGITSLRDWAIADTKATRDVDLGSQGVEGQSIEAGVEGQRIAADAATEQARIAAEVETLNVGEPLP